MKNKANIIKNTLLVAIPILIVIASIIWIVVGLKDKNEYAEINIAVSFLEEEYVLGKAVVKETSFTPSQRTYEFETWEAKDDFINKIMIEKNIVAEFTAKIKKVYYFVDNEKMYGIDDFKEDNSISFYTSSAMILYKNKRLYIPMLKTTTYWGETTTLTVGESVVVSFDKVLCTYYDENFKRYEDFKGVYEKANKDSIIAEFNDTEKTISIKAILSNNDFDIIEYPKVELSFSKEGMIVKYLGEN